MQGALDWHPAPKPVLEAAKQARAAANAHGVDIGTLAFKESARLPGVAVHLIGMRTPDEVPAQAPQQPHEIIQSVLHTIECNDLIAAVLYCKSA